MTRPRRHVRAGLATVLAVGAVVVAGCGISADTRVTNIPAGDLRGLADTTTTTTTTTTTVPPTVPPTSVTESVPIPTTTTTTTTTVEPIQSIEVPVFYVPRGRDTVLKRVTAAVPRDYTPMDLIDLLSRPSPGLGLVTAVEPGLIPSPPVIEAVATTVDLDGTVFGEMNESAKQQAIAQIVLTLTPYVDPLYGPLAAIVFTVDGSPIEVSLPGQGATEPGEPVRFSDFSGLIDSSTLPTGTSTTTTTTVPTSAPPSVPEGGAEPATSVAPGG